MKKIYKLKKWYSIEDAANRLSLTLSENVSVKDVIEFALDDHINLFWYMRHVPAIEVELKKNEIPFLTEKIRRQSLKQAGIDPETSDINTFITLNYYPKNPNGRIEILEGAHQLRLHECDALSDYLRSFLTNTGGELLSLDGFQVQDDKGVIWAIRERFEDHVLTSQENWNEENLGPYSPMSAHNYFPSADFPSFSELGFTKSELETFERSIQGKQPHEVSNREQKTTFKIILGMAMEQYGYDPKALRNDAARIIADDLREQGITLDEDTVRKYLKMAKNVVLDDLD